MPRTAHPRYHIGLRTVKTGTAVMLALLLDSMRPSAMPIFAAIGAIVVMSRTLSDAITAASTQLAGITCGAIAGCLFSLLFPNNHYIAIGLGLILLIPICHPLRIGFAVPLTCIVFVSVCLYDPSTGSPIAYGINRFLDTSIGLSTGFVINAVLKPYNNYPLILRLFRSYQETCPAALRELLVDGHYPDLAPFERQCRRLYDEIRIFGDQPFANQKRKQDTAYLWGCYQLAEKIHFELAALAGMDTLGVPNDEMRARLHEMNVDVPDEIPIPGLDEESLVLGYHLKNLLDAHDYLQGLLDLPKEPPHP